MDYKKTQLGTASLCLMALMFALLFAANEKPDEPIALFLSCWWLLLCYFHR